MIRSAKTLIGICGAAWMLVLSGAPEPVYERRPFKEEYVDADTGVKLPPRIGDYKKNEVVRNFNPLIGTVVRYADSQGNCADIYIYSLDSSNLDVSPQAALEHFKEIKHAIENLPKRHSHVKEVIPQGEEPLKHPPNVFGRTASFRLNIAGDLRNSELAVFPFKRKIVKIRVSSSPYSSKEDFHFADFLEVVCKAFNAVK